MSGWEQLIRPCPLAEGTRVELIEMPDDPAPIEPGTRGTVVGGNGCQLFMRWDNGRTLILLVDVDSYRVLDSPNEPPHREDH